MNCLLIFLSLLLLFQLVLRRSNSLRVKQRCQLSHVPKRLHWDGKTIIYNFFHEEKLYWRRKKEDILKDNDNPFLSIKLADVSVNRSGKSGLLFSFPEDTLINITDSENTHYKGFDVLELSINKIDFHTQTKKIFVEPQNVDFNEKQYIVEMCLIHDPLDCNRAHSMFRFKFDGQFVNFEDYSNSFGISKPKSIKILRSSCKDELRKMIMRRIVDFE